MIKINGNKEIVMFLINEFEINLIVVSEKIIKKIPIKNVISFNLKYFKFSFDCIIRSNGTKDNTKI